MHSLSGTKYVNASQLEVGDIILNDDGSYYSTVIAAYWDDGDLWLDDGHNMGYIDPYTQYLIEWDYP